MKQKFYPTQTQQRIELLDVLRGFAIFGVLIANILYFSGYIYTPFSDFEKMSFPKLNGVLINVLFSAFLGKFYPILCILFGAGIYMQFQKSNKAGFMKFFIRRMLFLVLIGALHQFIWAGDVVLVYALFAFLLLPLRKLKPKGYLIIAIVLFILNFIVLYAIDLMKVPNTEVEQIAFLQFPNVVPHDLIYTVKNEGLQGFIYIIKTQWSQVWTIERYSSLGLRILGLFMVGAYLFGSGFLTEKAHKIKFFIIFLFLGLMGTYLMYYVSWHFKIIDNLFLALAYISLIALIMKSIRGRKILSGLAPLGRMALTNYILQSVICIIIFYGIGFGFYAELPLYIVILIAIAILIFQILFSKYWLKKYNFGPVEWLWRKLSYGAITYKAPSKNPE